jgi:hypothetical protein
MNRLIGSIVNNPAVLLWIAGAALALGLFAGGGVAWKVQGWRLDAAKAELKTTKAEYATFVRETERLGIEAQAKANKKAKADKEAKQEADHAYETRINLLTADNRRMRNARSNSNFVPAATAGTENPYLVCFDRTQLESAIRDLDLGVQGLVDRGDEAAVGLEVARKWAVKVSPPDK